MASYRKTTSDSKEHGAGVDQSVQRLGYGLDDRGSIPGKGRIFFSLCPHPDWFWSHPASRGYRGSFP